jgi:hypothetical protein
MSIIVRLRAVFRILLVFGVIFGQSWPASADAKFPSYLVDLLVENCMSHQASGIHAVYAFSPIEFGFCSFGSADLASHRDAALAGCTRQIPQQFKASAACSIIVEDGRVLNKSILAHHRKEISVPAEIEIFDGRTGKTEKIKGFVTTGRYVSMTHQVGRITLGNGKVLCDGFRLDRPTGRSFQGKCFGKFEFKGPLPSPKGIFLYNGSYVVKTTFTMKNGKSYIKITTGP